MRIRVPGVPQRPGRFGHGRTYCHAVRYAASGGTLRRLPRIKNFWACLRRVPPLRCRAGANATEFGVAAAVFTRDIDRARRVSRQINAGTAWTNTWLAINNGFEEGGFKQSGIGRLRGARGLADFQEIKTYVQLVPRPATDTAPATHD